MICLDASVAAKLVLPEDFSPQALALVAATVAAPRPIIAPSLLPFEMANILRQRVRRGSVPQAEADASLADFLSIPITFMTPPRLYETAFQITAERDLPAAYDAHYVALAQLFGCHLWTDDRPLLRALGDDFPFVRWIGDASLPSS